MNNEPKLVILYYSAYSEDCKRFIDTAKKFGLDYITPVCIDNISVRQEVKTKIKYVPTIMLVYNEEMIDTYEGEKAMLWLNSIVAPMQEKLEREERERIYQQQEMMRQQQIFQEQTMIKQKRRAHDEVEEEEEEEEERKPMRKQSGIQEIDGPLPTSGKKKKNTNTSTKGKKSAEELKSLASEMQKSREDIDKEIFPPLGPKPPKKASKKKHTKLEEE